ncbi:hypothetical protein L1987_15322 [Smallanthus sonchifolius]|uniref:Uncharacterized protein n=1 Tax=Smallanthus sonchifolius TaxID=185202 RepID=A0ACB9J7U1_9ASTR|nr:hypothetical protein L1987_15322 [Smallanthus sonchifolius]
MTPLQSIHHSVSDTQKPEYYQHWCVVPHNSQEEVCALTFKLSEIQLAAFILLCAGCTRAQLNPSLCISQATLALFAARKSTGILVNVGFNQNLLYQENDEDCDDLLKARVISEIRS